MGNPFGFCQQAGGVEWLEREVTVMGRRVLQPRLVAYMADDASLAYTYSRSTMLPATWSAPVRAIKVGVVLSVAIL